MSEKRQAFYYRGQYFLLPSEFASLEELKDSFADKPMRLKLQLLTEDNKVHSMIRKGVCIAPYFYSEYGFIEANAELESAAELYPVNVELLTQKEYNERLRQVILDNCPGCQRYKPISNRVQSLNSHFNEIALNGVCLYRSNSKPFPRVFKNSLFSLGGLWYHFDPCVQDTKLVVDLIKSQTYLTFASAEKKDDPTRMRAMIKPDFFSKILFTVLEQYIEKALYFTKFRIEFESDLTVGIDEFQNQISCENRESFRKNCKKYGVAFAVLDYEQTKTGEVKRSLEDMFGHYFAVPLFSEPGKEYLLLLDESAFLRGLHFRSPLLNAANATVKVFDQFEECEFRVSFEMERM